MRAVFFAISMFSAAAWCQEAPVTRAEFAELFSAVARGYVAEGAKSLPEGFKKDNAPVSRDEVAQAMVLVAVGSGKIAVAQSSAIETLRLAKILESNPAFFSNPGSNFRPADLVAALVSFSDGISNRNKPQSADDKRLTTPKIGRNGGIMNIKEVEGIGEVFGAKLSDAGVGSTDALLAAGASPAGREQLASQIGVDSSRILEWVNRVDLMRVKGVGSEYSDLLEAAGVDTVPELAQRNPANLAEAIATTIEAKGLVRRPPSASEIESWVAHAKELGRAITY